MATISPSSGSRCCNCWRFCAKSGCSRCKILLSGMVANGDSYMIILGLTGSIGMGKSTTAQLFAEAGVPVYDADATVHRLYEGEAVSAIEAAFPGTTTAGKVDRGALGKRVTGDAPALRIVEAIVHPLV